MRNAFSFKPYIRRFEHSRTGNGHRAQPSQHATDTTSAFAEAMADEASNHQPSTDNPHNPQPTTITTPASAEATAGTALSLLLRHNALPLRLGLMTLVFITALYTKAYTGDYQVIINNHIGGVFYVMFGSLAFSIILPRWKQHQQVLLALSLTSILELVQWLQIPFMLELTRYRAFAYIFGNSYNPLDFIYYGVGAVLGMGVLMLVRE